MKAEPTFQPIKITLTSEEEVSALYVILRHAYIQNSLQFIANPRLAATVLEKYVSEPDKAFNEFADKLDKEFKKSFENRNT